MLRLYSISGLYSFVVGLPIFCLVVMILSDNFGNDALLMALIPVLLLMLYWVFAIRRWKKVYFESGRLYIFNPFSNASTIVSKANVGGINKIMFYDPRFYKIIYYDENQVAKYVYFQRNWSLSNFYDIIDSFN